MAKNQFDEINRQFRAAMSRVNPNCRLNFEKMIQCLLDYKSLRNVQLMTREGKTTRAFVRDGVGENELLIRKRIARLVIEHSKAPNFPTNQKLFTDENPQKAARELEKYLERNTFTADNSVRIVFYGGFGGYALEYAQDSGNENDDDDLDPNIDTDNLFEL